MNSRRRRKFEAVFFTEFDDARNFLLRRRHRVEFLEEFFKSRRRDDYQHFARGISGIGVMVRVAARSKNRRSRCCQMVPVAAENFVFAFEHVKSFVFPAVRMWRGSAGWCVRSFDDGKRAAGFAAMNFDFVSSAENIYPPTGFGRDNDWFSHKSNFVVSQSAGGSEPVQVRFG